MVIFLSSFIFEFVGDVVANLSMKVILPKDFAYRTIDTICTYDSLAWSWIFYVYLAWLPLAIPGSQFSTYDYDNMLHIVVICMLIKQCIKYKFKYKYKLKELRKVVINMSDHQQTKTKTKEELEAEQQAAKEQLNAILDSSRPKHLGQGITSGVGNIISGAVGAVGVAVLAPTVGLGVGSKQGGILGGAVGLMGGAVAGVVGGTVIVLGSAVQGVTQVIRGAAATPEAIIAPSKGKWWNEVEGKWVLTKLDEDYQKMLDIPHDDEDILGRALKDVNDTNKPPKVVTASKVKDTSYYDALEVTPDTEASKMKRQYYLLARKYHPDKVGKDNKEAADKFSDIAEAYQVLSDPELRSIYDTEGKDGLSADRTGVATDGVNKPDPAILFAFLFGSDKFGEYTGRLATATSALVADSPKITPSEARILQYRRVTRLALKLAERLAPWVEEDYDGAKAIWTSAAEDLCQASYGTELLHLIGKIYSLQSHRILGSSRSGMGMPSIAQWAKAQQSKMKDSAETSKAKRDGLMAGMTMMTLQQKHQAEIAKATTDEEKKKLKAAMEQQLMLAKLNVYWTTTVVDLTTTLHEVVEMVLHDQSVNKDTRIRRAYGLKHLGEMFMECKGRPSIGGDAKKMYEEAAFAAMLETIKRKEEAAHSHTMN